MPFTTRSRITTGTKCSSTICLSGVRAFVLRCFSRTTARVRLGIIGEMDESGKAAYLWTHKKFEIGYNGNRIVDVNLTSEGKVQIEPQKKIAFSYEVLWKQSTTPFASRFDKYLDPGFFQHKVVPVAFPPFVLRTVRCRSTGSRSSTRS